MISLGITDVVNRPDPIKLRDGSIIVLNEWRLDRDSAKCLYRPFDSAERNLRLKGRYFESATNPSASWYLSKVDYFAFMELIRAQKLQFNVAKDMIDSVRSSADASRLRDYLTALN